ncbi:hypothetical protein Syun_025524 [Stephania yunnanensis]|uniref:Uncharacterized protein n=1 Tax=Stephania yunnanensis TaxID=152371 RepID=A0AAP0ESB5_9MAGN
MSCSNKIFCHNSYTSPGTSIELIFYTKRQDDEKYKHRDLLQSNQGKSTFSKREVSITNKLQQEERDESKNRNTRHMRPSIHIVMGSHISQKILNKIIR